MIAYHLDHSGSLKEGTTLELFNTDANPNDPTIQLYGLNQVSNWGMSCYKYLLNLSSNSDAVMDFSSANSFSIELQVESIRQKLHPDKPSRFKSILQLKISMISDFGKIFFR